MACTKDNIHEHRSFFCSPWSRTKSRWATGEPWTIVFGKRKAVREAETCRSGNCLMAKMVLLATCILHRVHRIHCLAIGEAPIFLCTLYIAYSEYFWQFASCFALSLCALFMSVFISMRACIAKWETREQVQMLCLRQNISIAPL